MKGGGGGARSFSVWSIGVPDSGQKPRNVINLGARSVRRQY